MFKPPIVTLPLPGAAPRLAVSPPRPLPRSDMARVIGGQGVDVQVQALVQMARAAAHQE